MSTEPSPPAPTHCLNCQAALSGPFCSQCGQSAEVHVLSTHELLHEVFEGVTHSDSRLWRTLRALWLHPGQLTLEFIHGRRAAYLPPFRLYLVVSIVFFLAVASSGTGLGVIRNDPSTGMHFKTENALRESDCDFDWFQNVRPEWDARFKQGCLAALHDNGHTWGHLAVSMLPKAMFVFVPLVALIHMLLYWRPRHRYAEHWVFFLHLHAFFFCIMSVVFGLSMLGQAATSLLPVIRVLQPLLQVSLIVYTLMAMRRVFANGWGLTVVKGTVLFFAYWLLLSLTIAIVFVYAALQL